MRFQAFSATALSIILIPLSAAQVASNFFVISSLNTTLPANTTVTPATFRFTVADPSPKSNASTTCGASWRANGSHPTSWTRCADPSYSWYLSSFNNLSSFTIEAQHSFTDPSLGPPPFDGETQFAHATFGPANLTCWGHGRRGRECILKHGTEAQLRVYAVVA